MRESFRFIFGFAWRDLSDRHNRFTSLVNVFTVAFIVMCVILANGWTLGVQRIGEEEIRRDPLNLCLWVGSDLRGRRLDRELAAHLERRIGQELGPTALVGCYVIGDTDFSWRHKTERRTVRIGGRTIVPQDPLLQSLELQNPNRRYLSPDEEGVIVSRAMLNALGYELTEYPANLVVELPSGGTREVPVLDIAMPPGNRDAASATRLERPVLPLGHEFVISEAFDTRLRNENPDEPVPEIRTGPVPDDWPTDPDQLPPVVLQSLDTYELLLTVETFEDENYWRLTYRGFRQTPILSQWRAFLDRINEGMRESRHPDFPARNFSRAAQLLPELPAQKTRPPVVREQYDWLGVYLRELRYLSPADDLLLSEQLTSRNRSIIDRLENLQDQTRLTLRILVFVGLLVLTLAVWNMFVIEFHRNARKIPEIGMLKAIGMGRLSLVGLAACEASILWAFGLSLGVVLGFTAGFGGAVYQYGWGRAATGFAFSGQVLLTGALASAAICILGSLAATYHAHSSPPSESLRGLVRRPSLCGQVWQFLVREKNREKTELSVDSDSEVK